MRFRRGADQPRDDTGSHAGQHVAGAKQGKPGCDRVAATAASETFADTAEPNPVDETGSL